MHRNAPIGQWLPMRVDGSLPQFLAIQRSAVTEGLLKKTSYVDLCVIEVWFWERSEVVSRTVVAAIRLTDPHDDGVSSSCIVGGCKLIQCHLEIGMILTLQQYSSVTWLSRPSQSVP